MERLGAVKEHHSVILKSMAISARSKNPRILVNTNNFTIPGSREDDAWKARAIEAQAEEVRAAKDLEAGLAAERAGHSAPDPAPPARSPKRVGVQPAKWKAGRSAAIKRGHATRKRNAAKRADTKRAMARRPR